MKANKTPLYLFDFDSTFITSEGLDTLAEITLRNKPDKKERLAKIVDLTNQGMEGKIPFSESLRQRIALLQGTRNDVKKVSKILARKISKSIARNKAFFVENREHVYIVSGGFSDIIVPVVKEFGIAQDHIFANTLLYDKNGIITGIDTTNPMSKDKGKVAIAKKLKKNNELYIIGDGYTDYEIKKVGIADKFIAFTENVQRQVVIDNADHVAPTFDEFLFSLKLPSAVSYPKNRIKVLLLENVHKDAVALFEQEGYQVQFYEKSLSEEELIKQIKDVSILGIRSKTKITQNVINAAPRLLAIGVFAIGTNQIDLIAATRAGVCVFNAPYSNTRSVAEQIIGEIIMLSRKTFEKSIKLHAGVWDKSALGCHEIRGKKLGIIGYGHIGSQVSVMAESLGMDVYYYNTSDKLAYGNATKCNSMQEVLKIADVVTIHVSGKPQNHNLIGDKEFKQMKDGVIFLNASRGFVVTIDDLVKHLQSGKVAGAAIDVFPKEPEKNGDPFVTPLQQIPNVLLTPHMGSGTLEAQQNIANYVPKKVIAFINSGDTDMSVNMPNMHLPLQGKTHRFLHLHKNVPGILGKINSILAENNINILGQYLKTQDEIGYVITDVNKKYDKKVIDVLRNIPDTIKLRVLY